MDSVNENDTATARRVAILIPCGQAASAVANETPLVARSAGRMRLVYLRIQKTSDTH